MKMVSVYLRSHLVQVIVMQETQFRSQGLSSVQVMEVLQVLESIRLQQIIVELIPLASSLRIIFDLLDPMSQQVR